MAKQTINFETKVFLDLITRLIKKAVPKSKTAAIIKSKGDQFQPSTNRFPKNAVAINKAGTAKMIVDFCFSKVIFLSFNNIKYFAIQSIMIKKYKDYLPNNFSKAFKCSVKASLPLWVTL